MKKIILLIIGIALLAPIAGASWYFQMLRPVAASGETQTITIEPGQSLRAVGRTLAQRDIIRSERAFAWHARARNATAKLQAGDHDLSPAMSTPEIVAAITSGSHLSREQQLTIIEGWSAAQIGAYVQEKLGISQEQWQAAIATEKWRGEYEYLNSATAPTVEGFLFPDTYRVFKNTTAESVIARMLGRFDQQLTVEMRSAIAAQGKSIFEAVIMASIVEREAKAPDMAMVADIFWKRLEIGMALQSDATVNYIVGAGRARATFDDIAIDSPYNTYKYRGLPPGPISNPGLAAIKAAIYPAQNDFYYFLTDEGGKAYYARTYQEHQANIAAHLD